MTDVAATTEQPATNDPNPAIEPAAGSGEQSLDDVLASLQTEDTPPAQPEPTPQTEESPVEARLKAVERELQAANTKTAVGEIISSIKTDNPTLGILGEKMLEARILLQADNDPRFAQAYALRGQNPAAFKQVMDAFGRQIASEVGEAPNPQLTADAEAARTAVRGASTSAPAEDKPDPKAENERLSKMSDAKFEAEMLKAGA